VQFVFQVVDCPLVSLQMKPCRQAVKDRFPEPSEHHITTKELARRLGSRSSNVISDPSCTFKGYVHCEAMLETPSHAASLHHAGRTESTVPLEELETLDAELLQEEEAEVKADADKARPGLTIFTDGSRMENRAAGYAVVRKKGSSWGTSKPTWVINRRPTMRSARPRKGAGISCEKADRARARHNLQGCPSRHQTYGTGGAGPWPAVRPPGEEAHRRAAEGQARHHHQNPVMPSARGSPATRRPTSGQRLRRRSLTPVGWNGLNIRTGRKHALCRSQDLLRT